MNDCHVTLHFDDATTATVVDARKKIETSGIPCNLPGYRPHMTIGRFPAERFDEVCTHVAAFCNRQKHIAVRLHYLGVFPEKNIIFMAPRPSAALHHLQESFTSQLCTLHKIPMTDPESRYWTPHCTLVNGIAAARLGDAMLACKQHFNPLIGHIIALGIVYGGEKTDRHIYSLT